MLTKEYGTMSIERKKNIKKIDKNQQLFSIPPKTDFDPDRKPTFQQKSDPDQCQKVSPAGLYLSVSQTQMCTSYSSTLT
jgi:hypothetical protein